MVPPEISATGAWNDVADLTTSQFKIGGTQYPNHGVVEVIPEPASALLLGVATLGLTLRRRRV